MLALACVTNWGLAVYYSTARDSMKVSVLLKENYRPNKAKCLLHMFRWFNFDSFFRLCPVCILGWNGGSVVVRSRRHCGAGIITTGINRTTSISWSDTQNGDNDLSSTILTPTSDHHHNHSHQQRAPITIDGVVCPAPPPVYSATVDQGASDESHYMVSLQEVISPDAHDSALNGVLNGFIGGRR